MSRQQRDYGRASPSARARRDVSELSHETQDAAVCSVLTDAAARANRRATDLATLRELIELAQLPEWMRYYVQNAIEWMADDETKILGGSQRDKFELQLRLLKAGRVLMPPVPTGLRRYVVRRDQLHQRHGREQKERAQESMVTNTPWMKDAALLPKRPPGKSGGDRSGA